MSKKTILVVEDNEFTREQLVELLGRHGYKVLAAENGYQAIAIFCGPVEPDLILMDMLVPPPDGWHLLAVRKNTPTLATVPVLIISALEIATKEWALSLGASGLIPKPVDADSLLSEIRSCLGGCQG